MSTVMTNKAMSPSRSVKTGQKAVVPRATYHHGDLAHALVDIATVLVRRDGGEGFSLRAAAKELGVDPAAAYRHFADKDALLRAVAVNGFGALAASMEVGVARALDAGGRFAAVGHAYVDFAVREPALFRLMFAGAVIAPAEVSGVARAPSRILTDSIDELRAAGLCNVEPAGAALHAWSAVHGLAFLILDARLGPGPHDGAIASVVAGVMTAFAAGSAGLEASAG
jgi:AcrR family transcriptional regulator